MKKRKHFPSQENHRNHGDGDRENLAETEAATARLETSSDQTQNVQGCKAKDQDPENVVDVASLAGSLIRKLECDEEHRLQANQARPQPSARGNSCECGGEGRYHGSV